MRTKDTILLEDAYDKVNNPKLKAFKDFAEMQGPLTLKILAKVLNEKGIRLDNFIWSTAITDAESADPEVYGLSSKDYAELKENKQYGWGRAYSESNGVLQLTDQTLNWLADFGIHTGERLLDYIDNHYENFNDAFNPDYNENGKKGNLDPNNIVKVDISNLDDSPIFSEEDAEEEEEY